MQRFLVANGLEVHRAFEHLVHRGLSSDDFKTSAGIPVLVYYPFASAGKSSMQCAFEFYMKAAACAGKDDFFGWYGDVPGYPITNLTGLSPEPGSLFWEKIDLIRGWTPEFALTHQFSCYSADEDFGNPHHPHMGMLAMALYNWSESSNWPDVPAFLIPGMKVDGYGPSNQGRHTTDAYMLLSRNEQKELSLHIGGYEFSAGLCSIPLITARKYLGCYSHLYR